MAEKREHACPRCGKNEWELQTRPGKAGTGKVWDTGEVKEWVCLCGYYERKD
jgi:hypothetical protein